MAGLRGGREKNGGGGNMIKQGKLRMGRGKEVRE